MASFDVILSNMVLGDDTYIETPEGNKIPQTELAVVRYYPEFSYRGLCNKRIFIKTYVKLNIRKYFNISLLDFLKLGIDEAMEYIKIAEELMEEEIEDNEDNINKLKEQTEELNDILNV